MDDKWFGFVSSIGGLIVGWTLNELGFLFKNRRENKRILNQILFAQLEIRSILKKTDLIGIEKQLEELAQQKLPDVDPKDFNDTIGKLFYGFIQNQLNKKFSSRIPALCSEYKSYLTALSQIDPFTTYYLTGKDLVLDYLGFLKSYLQEIEVYLDQNVIGDPINEKSQTRTFKETFEHITSILTPLLRKKAIDTVEEDIISIARKIGFFRFIITKRFLKRTAESKLDDSDVKRLELYFDNFKKVGS